MTLGDFLTTRGLTVADFAALIQRPQPTVSRYVAGKRIPEPGVMKDIFRATDELVEPNDFYPFVAASRAKRRAA